MNIIFLILVGVVGFTIGRATGNKSSKASFQNPQEREEAQKASRDALSERTNERKEEILEMMQDAREHYEDLKKCDLVKERKGIKREDVEDLLDVSKKTALSYLDALEKDKKIKQIDVGRNTYYVLYS